MLQALRDQTSSWVIKILLGLLVLSFAIWGINDVFLGERDPVVVKVGDMKLARSQVNDEIREEMNRLQPMFSGRLDRAEADRMGITGQVVENIVNRAAVSQGAADLGITISDQMIAQRIQSDATFFNSRGQFDRAIFAQVLSRAGMTEGYYVSNLKRDLAAAEINRAISGAVPVPEMLVDPLVRFRSERRIARTVQLPLVAQSAIAEPTAAEIESYYKANTQRFMAPQLRDVTWIELDPGALAAETAIAEDRLRKAYDERKDEFATHDRREVEQVVFRTEAAAAQASGQIAAGKSLADAAKAVDAKLKPVSLGWIERKDALPELVDRIFALKKGEISKPLKSALGWHIVAIRNAEAGRQRSFAETREQIRKELASREALDAILAVTNKIEDALASGATIEETARQFNLKSHRATSLDSRGRNQASEAVDGLPKSGNFLRVAFETADGQDSPLTETQNGGFFILHVNKVTPPAVRPLDAVRADVVKVRKAEARAKATQARARIILDKIKSGQKIDGIAKAEKLALKTTPAFTRLTHDAESGLPAALMDQMFSLKVGEAAMAEGDTGYVVAVLTAIRAPSEKEKSEAANALREEMRQGIAGDLFQQFVGALRARYSVTVKTELLRERQ